MKSEPGIHLCTMLHNKPPGNNLFRSLVVTKINRVCPNLLGNRSGTSHEYANHANNQQNYAGAESDISAERMYTTCACHVVYTHGDGNRAKSDDSIENCGILHL